MASDKRWPQNVSQKKAQNSGVSSSCLISLNHSSTGLESCSVVSKCSRNWDGGGGQNSDLRVVSTHLKNLILILFLASGKQLMFLTLFLPKLQNSDRPRLWKMTYVQIIGKETYWLLSLNPDKSGCLKSSFCCYRFFSFSRQVSQVSHRAGCCTGARDE